MFKSAELELLQSVLRQDLLRALGETLYMTFFPTILAFLIGLPLGVLLFTGEQGGLRPLPRPLPRPLLRALNILINLLRSIPFLVLVMVLLPLTRLLVGTTVGSRAMTVSLAIAAFPFVARLVETSLREVDQGVVEAALAMGASPLQIVWKVLLAEARPALIANFVVTLITIFGYNAMSGVLGGGGIGAIAVNYGYYRSRPLVMYAMVLLMILLVQLFQSVGNAVVRRSDKRIR